DDIELEHSCESATVRRRRNLRDVQWGRDCRYADAEATDEARRSKSVNAPSKRAAQRRDDVKKADRHQRAPTSEMVGGPPAKQGTQHGPVEGGAHCETVHAGAQAPQ